MEEELRQTVFYVFNSSTNFKKVKNLEITKEKIYTYESDFNEAVGYLIHWKIQFMKNLSFFEKQTFKGLLLKKVSVGEINISNLHVRACCI